MSIDFDVTGKGRALPASLRPILVNRPRRSRRGQTGVLGAHVARYFACCFHKTTETSISVERWWFVASRCSARQPTCIYSVDY